MRRYFGRQSLSRTSVSSGGRPQCPLLSLVVEAGAITCLWRIDVLTDSTGESIAQVKRVTEA